MTSMQEILVLIVVVLALFYLPRLMNRRQEARQTRKMIVIPGRVRLAIVASVLWPLIAGMVLEPWHKNFIFFIYIGIVPVIIVWGIIWVIHGYRKKKKDK